MPIKKKAPIPMGTKKVVVKAAPKKVPAKPMKSCCR
jgi:hypothetical protein